MSKGPGERQFDALIKQLYDEGWGYKRIAKRIGRSHSYVENRVGIRDPLGPLAFDPGTPVRPTLEAVFARHPINAHKPGGWA